MFLELQVVKLSVGWVAGTATRYVTILYASNPSADFVALGSVDL